MHYFAKAGAIFLLSASAQTLPDGLVGLSEPSGDIVGGITDAFLGSSKVSSEERRCLSNGASSFTTSLTNACEQALGTYKQFTAPAVPTASHVITSPAVAGVPATNYAATSTAGSPAFNPFEPAAPTTVAATPIVPTQLVSEGETAVMAMELAASLSQVYKVQSKIAKSCLKGDVLAEFDKAEKHLSNMTYVSGRLLTEGVDVMDELSDAFKSFEHQNYRAFGKDLGTAGRKVLLAKHSGLADFKAPSDEAIEEVTEGLFASFFGKGYDLQIVADDALAVPVSAPQVPVASASPAFVRSTQPGALPTTWPVAPPAGSLTTASPGATTFLATPFPATTLAPATLVPATSLAPAKLNIDLHKCISDNMVFWKSAWNPVFELAAAAASGSESEVPDMSELMMSMMHVQMAMTRCKITPEMEAILIDSIEAGKLHANLNMPKGQINNGGVPSLLASALEDFKDRSWYAFGNQLGAAMQDMLVVTLDQKYEVDAAGNLRQRLASRKSLGVVAVGAVSVGLLAMFAVARSRRTVRAATRRTTEFDRLVQAPGFLESDLEASVE